MNESVKQKFRSYPDHIRPQMEQLRKLIYETAENTEGAGELEETLKWGEPAYLTSKPKSGTTIRIDWKERNPDQLAMYVNCSTTLVSDYRSLFANELQFEGNRAILFPAGKPLPEKQLTICIQMALRYHLDKNKQG